MEIQKYSRSHFLRFSFKLFALTSLSLKGINCGSVLSTPPLRGITAEHYHNIRSIGEVFLDGNPVADFDLGLAFDNYAFGHPTPIDTWPIMEELAGIPSSRLASLALDFSWTPMVALSKENREKRLLSWKTSSLALKRGAYLIMRQFSYFLLSSSPEYTQYSGYKG